MIVFDNVDYVFRDYVNFMYKRRKESNSEFNNIFYKLLMNSLYGKFATQFYNTKYVSRDELKDMPSEFLEQNIIMKIEDNYYSITDALMKKQLAKNDIVHLASNVTSYARMVMYEMFKKYESDLVRILSYWVFPILFLAEWFSWYSVLTTNYIGNTVEESLWCLSGILLVITSLSLVQKTEGRERLLFLTMGIYASLYVIFMTTVDVPMYYTRFIDDTLQEKIYFTLSQGFHEVNTNWYVTHSYSDWKGEQAWMFLYFTSAVWASLGMIRTPFLLRHTDRLRSYRGVFTQNIRNS
jgi:hypothetical protein